MTPATPVAGSPGRVWGWLAVLLCATLVIRLGLLTTTYDAHPQRVLAQDSAAYERLAESIQHRGDFRLRRVGDRVRRGNV